MDQKKLLKWIIGVMFLMFLANNLAWKFHWYYTIWWFDVLMHFSGGFWVSLFFLYVFGGKYSTFKNFIVVISSVLVVGILWEFFEAYLNVLSLDSFDWGDTSSDVFLDLFGGSVAILYFHKKIMKPVQNKLE